MRCGAMEVYDKTYDRVTTKNEKRLKRINRIFHKVTTTDDPIIRQVSKNVCFEKLKDDSYKNNHPMEHWPLKNLFNLDQVRF